jgi:Fic family protein
MRLFIEETIHVHRNTAAYYLNQLLDIGLLEKIMLGKSNYFINVELYNFFKQRYAQE